MISWYSCSLMCGDAGECVGLGDCFGCFGGATGEGTLMQVAASGI